MNTWLIIGWLFSASWLPLQTYGMYPTDSISDAIYENHNNATKIEFNIDACLWNHWDIYGGMASYQKFGGITGMGISFEPYTIDYWIGTEVYVMPKDTKGLNVSVFAKHECQHPVTIGTGKYRETSSFNQAYTEVGINVKGSISF